MMVTHSGNCPDADPSMMTRAEALSAALQVRRSPEPERAYSTLIVALPSAECIPECHYDRSGNPVHIWLTGGSCPHAEDQVLGIMRRRDQGFDRLLGAVEAYGGDRDGDEAEDEQSAVPDAPANDEDQKARRSEQS